MFSTVRAARAAQRLGLVAVEHHRARAVARRPVPAAPAAAAAAARPVRGGAGAAAAGAAPPSAVGGRSRRSTSRQCSSTDAGFSR